MSCILDVLLLAVIGIVAALVVHGVVRLCGRLFDDWSPNHEAQVTHKPDKQATVDELKKAWAEANADFDKWDRLWRRTLLSGGPKKKVAYRRRDAARDRGARIAAQLAKRGVDVLGDE